MAVATTVETQYVSVPVSTLVPGTVTGFCLYLADGDAEPRLYRAADYPLDEEDVRRLGERGITSLLLRSGDHEAYQAYLRTNLSAVLLDERIPVGQRFEALNSVVRDVLSRAFAKGNVDETVAAAEEMATQTVGLICRRDFVASDLFRVLQHDFHTFTHSANVSYYCVLLAREGGVECEEELHEIATGALLHDLGKLEIPESVLTKPGKLTDEEFRIVKRHPTTGLERLRDREDVSFGQLMMVYQHHERLDGGGYPVGVPAEEIHPWARLCGVVDVFEALTSNRPYRAALPTSEAFRILDRQSGKGLERDLVERWKQILVRKN